MPTYYPLHKAVTGQSAYVVDSYLDIEWTHTEVLPANLLSGFEVVVFSGTDPDTAANRLHEPVLVGPDERRVVIGVHAQTNLTIKVAVRSRYINGSVSDWRTYSGTEDLTHTEFKLAKGDLSNVDAGSVTTTLIGDNQVSADKIVQASIKPSHLSRALVSAIHGVPNGAFESETLTGFDAWTVAEGFYGSGQDVWRSFDALQGSLCAEFLGTANNTRLRTEDFIPAKENHLYELSGWVIPTDTTDGAAYIGVEWYAAGFSLISTSSISKTLTGITSWTKLVDAVTAPANTVWARIIVYKDAVAYGFMVDDVQFEELPEPWIAPTLINSWGNFGTGGNGENQVAGYYKHKGIVYLRGLVAGGTAGTSSSSNIFLLPVGYRPDKVEMFQIVTNGSGGSGRLDVMPDGSVRLVAGSTTVVSLAGVFFRLPY